MEVAEQSERLAQPARPSGSPAAEQTAEVVVGEAGEFHDAVTGAGWQRTVAVDGDRYGLARLGIPEDLVRAAPPVNDPTYCQESFDKVAPRNHMRLRQPLPPPAPSPERDGPAPQQCFERRA